MSAEIRVAIADDHKIFRKGVILCLRPYANIKFVLEADNGEDLLNNLKEADPQVILMDLRMPVKDGIEATKYISKHYPNIAVLILTMHDEEKFVTHLMENGANGYLLKSADPLEIKKAITEVVAKGYYLNNFVNRILLKRAHAKAKNVSVPKGSTKVSDKEKDVLRYICMEFTSQQIGDKMDMSARSIETVKERLMERFGVRNTAGLVFYAVKNDLVE
ncbi:MAG: response regulator transcription factor [Chitinophagaceae bacterium]|nr:response regulator transcription factor [Chitinophagaceae bacterium]MCW5905178.1 response regulator transcription factor [Chitinophagaceae bacterium]